MFKPTRSNPNGFGTSGSGDLTLPPPTTLTEAFVAAHTDALCQILQAQQRMAQQLQQMPLMQQKLRPSKSCSLKVPTQSDMSAIVGATQLLEGQNSMLNQMVYDIIQGCYGNHLKLVSQTISLSLYLPLWSNRPGCSICWWSMLIKTNPRPPTPYYPFLDYQWILEKKRGKVEATSEYYMR
jgi:hypothetical protein